MPGWLVVLISFAYLGGLFAIAAWGDRRADQGRSIIDRPTVYALSLAVYCTTWTFYGSVGRAAAAGPSFLTIYFGPTLMVGLWWLVMRKILRVAKQQRITSIADFIGSRYGKSGLLAALVTLIAVIGIVPYIALQLKAISETFTLLMTGMGDTATVAPAMSSAVLVDSSFWIAMVLALFTILFGTRHLDVTERHEGMVAAVAFESIVKLVVFVAAGAFVTFVLFDGFGDIFRQAQAMPSLASLLALPDTALSYGRWAGLTLLSMLAFMMLPRQFQIGVVENVNEQHLHRAVWLFPLYLLLINLFVLPLALGGLIIFGEQGISADLYVLALPMAAGYDWLTLAVFIGGLSAGTGMVIVETIALSTMICNDIVVPILLRLRGRSLSAIEEISGTLLGVRRVAILAVIFLGYVYFRAAGEAYALVAIGLISFAAVAQFAPVFFGGLYWKGGTRDGALAGLLVGFAVWLYTLLLPSFAKSGWLSTDFLDGLFGLPLLKPQALFGLAGLDEITHCLFWSLLLNVMTYIAVSLLRQPDVEEARQAKLFVDALESDGQALHEAMWRGKASAEELEALVARFLGQARARMEFAAFTNRQGASDSGDASSAMVTFAENLLSGAIGSASARTILASVVQEETIGLDEVMSILDEASQVRAYSHALETKSRALEAASRDLHKANERLRELDHLKDDFISTVTHELRTPLTSIRAFSEILLDDPRTDLSERKRFLGIIVNETDRLTRLINQVLDLSKIESGQLDWDDDDCRLQEIVEQSVGATSSLFHDRGSVLAVDQPASAIMLRVDRDRLVQVMINLLSNAVKFVPKDSGQVTVRLGVQGDQARVEVIDNGPGVAKDDLERIFEKFRQGGNVLTDKPSGTGLGLPISRQIIEHYGGRLWVEALKAGQGAVFVFTLPLAAKAPPPVEET